MRALLCPLVLVGVLLSSVALAGCPAAFDTSLVWSADQVYSGTRTTYDWYFSGCTAEPYYANTTGCGSNPPKKVYVGQRSQRFCEFLMDDVLEDWQEVRGSNGGSDFFTATFTSRDRSRLAQFHVNCTTTATHFKAVGDVDVTSEGNGVFKYMMNFEANCAGGTFPPKTPAPTPQCPFESTSPVQWDANQNFNGQLTPYTWYYSACSEGAPSNLQPCANPKGFVGEWAPSNESGLCQFLMNIQTQPWSTTAPSTGVMTSTTSWNTVYRTNQGNKMATVTVNCVANTDGKFKPVRDVGVIYEAGTFNYFFEFDTDLCASTHSPMTPHPTTWSPMTPHPRTASPATLTPLPTASSIPAAPPVPTAFDNCGAYTNCATCTQSPSGNCGFCTGSKSCVKGTSSGPDSGSCFAGDWKWTFSQCNA